MKFISTSALATKQLAPKILKQLPPRHILALFGDLGSGKTTFTQGLAQALGITKRLISPTYVLMREYPIKNHPIYNSMLHLDLYRLPSSADLKSIDLDELISNPHALVVIEWAEKAKISLPPHQAIHFKIIDEYSREIIY